MSSEGFPVVVLQKHPRHGIDFVIYKVFLELDGQVCSNATTRPINNHRHGKTATCGNARAQLRWKLSVRLSVMRDESILAVDLP